MILRFVFHFCNCILLIFFQSAHADSSSFSQQSIADIRLKNEFEENRDIRLYLRKWQDITPKVLDPVRHVEMVNTSEHQAPWVGNMINFGSQETDATEDILRQTEEDMSEFLDIDDAGEGMHDYLEPGDLVAFKTLVLPILFTCRTLLIWQLSLDEVLRFNIYVRSVEKQQQFYTSKGKWRIANSKDIDFVVKGFATAADVAPLLRHFPDTIAELQPEMQSAIEGGVPREAGAHLLQMVGDFASQAHELYLANCTRFDSIHDIVADDEKQLQMSLDELACKTLEIEPDQLNDVIRYTVHQAARQFPFLIDKDRSTLFTNQYVIYPVPFSTVLEKVMAWYHEHQRLLVSTSSGSGDSTELRNNPVQRFVVKAQRLIRQSRKFRSPTTVGNVGPSSHRFLPGEDNNPAAYREMQTEAFTGSDKLILRFLQLWCTPPRRMSSAALRSAGSHILRSTVMYSGVELNAGTAALLLQELGVFTPWENLNVLDQDLGLPGHGPHSNALWSEVQQECDKLEKHGLHDKMKKMRKDWGKLPVYCVDAVDAEEIDDGVSLERIPGSDDTFWIRVHVANPSAFIDANGTIMDYAASRMQTVYVPERTYPMLPKSLTQSHFSLAPGRPSLTFSAKMNLKGELLDTEVSNGTVRNVIYLTHDKLRSVFGVQPSEPVPPLTVGGQITDQPARTGLRDKLSPEDEDTFHTLRKIMLAFREQRRKEGAMELPQSMETRVSVSAGNVPMKPNDVQLEHAGYMLGDPIIRLCPQKKDPHEILDMTKHDLISTIMNLACWVSAKWCAERNIPTVYDGTYYHPEYTPVTKDNISEYGGQGYLQLAAPRGVSSSHPLPHTPLGLDAYAKTTSPLRRYTDLIAHYQIEAALRFEHKHGRPIDAQIDNSLLPFTRDAVEEYISQSRWKRNRIRNVDQASKQFWACMLLFRAFYFGECELPKTFECIVHRPFNQTLLAGARFENVHMGQITSLGVRCSITAPPEMTDIDILSVVEAKITGVNPARAIVTMEATRVVSPFKRVGEWA